MVEVVEIRERILYEDRDIVVCHKPAGLAVQSAKIGQMDLESGLKNELSARQREGVPYLGVVHRLDQPVEGLVVFAKSQKAAANLNSQIAKRMVDKTYLAVVREVKTPSAGRLEDWLKRDGRKNLSLLWLQIRLAVKSCPRVRDSGQEWGKMLAQICLLMEDITRSGTDGSPGHASLGIRSMGRSRREASWGCAPVN
ncbi:MAG: pseudouridine synthase [Blautia sp.]